MVADPFIHPALAVDVPPHAAILLVDDDPVMLALLAGILGEMGEIVTAEDGERALDVLRERPVDVVLLDVDMPGLSGFEVVARIKSDPAYADLPVLFISGHHDVETEAQGLEAGAVDYIMKPLSPPIVRARVRTQLTLRARSRQLLRLASVDGLTGIANRRAFDIALNLEWRRSLRNHTPLSLVMVDIDFFKCFNDHYGHQAGDDCLKQVAAVLTTAAERPGELVARYGGEEFAAILPFCNGSSGAALAEKMRQRVAELRIPHVKSGICDHVTISCGVAEFVGATASGDEAELLHQADQALYAAKAAGRNQVKIAVPSPQRG